MLCIWVLPTYMYIVRPRRRILNYYCSWFYTWKEPCASNFSQVLPYISSYIVAATTIVITINLSTQNNMSYYDPQCLKIGTYVGMFNCGKNQTKKIFSAFTEKCWIMDIFLVAQIHVIYTLFHILSGLFGTMLKHVFEAEPEAAFPIVRSCSALCWVRVVLRNGHSCPFSSSSLLLPQS